MASHSWIREESCRLDQNEQVWMDVKDGGSSRYRMKLCCNTLKPRSLSVLRGFEKGFPGSSADKESAFNAGDPSSIPGSGRSAGEGIGYPLQDSWASMVAQPIKNLPAMRETWVQSLGWEEPLEKRTATPSSILAWTNPWTEGLGRLQSME